MDFDDDVCDMIMKLEKINETHRKCIDANNEKIAQLKKLQRSAVMDHALAQIRL